jgi:hypothetical protein
VDQEVGEDVEVQEVAVVVVEVDQDAKNLIISLVLMINIQSDYK